MCNQLPLEFIASMTDYKQHVFLIYIYIYYIYIYIYTYNNLNLRKKVGNLIKVRKEVVSLTQLEMAM